MEAHTTCEVVLPKNSSLNVITSLDLTTPLRGYRNMFEITTGMLSAKSRFRCVSKIQTLENFTGQTACLFQPLYHKGVAEGTEG